MSMEKDYYLGLGDRCWKLLPIFEGVDIKGEIVFDELVAIDNFEKNLSCLIVEIKGAIENYGSNSYCEQVLNLLAGLQSENNREHKLVKSVTVRCFKLCRKASEL